MGGAVWALAFAAGSLVTSAGHAQSADPIGTYTDQIRNCGALASKSARYACYDMANRAENKALRTPAQPSSVAKPAKALPAESFGVESMAAQARPKPEHAPVAQIVATAVSSTDTGLGYWTITLDNGARWRMLERVRQFIPPKPQQAVRIRRGALGSFLLFVGHQPGVQVQRIS